MYINEHQTMSSGVEQAHTLFSNMTGRLSIYVRNSTVINNVQVRRIHPNDVNNSI